MLIMWLGMLYTNSLDVFEAVSQQTSRRNGAQSFSWQRWHGAGGGAAMPDTGDGVDGVDGEAGGGKPHKMQNFKCLMNEG